MASFEDHEGDWRLSLRSKVARRHVRSERFGEMRRSWWPWLTGMLKKGVAEIRLDFRTNHSEAHCDA
jgi:hypothetical protein